MLRPFINTFFLLFMANFVDARACTELASILPASINPLIPKDPIICPQKFYANPTSSDRSYCQCLLKNRPVDAVVGSNNLSISENERLEEIIEDESVEGFRQEIESTLNNSLIFDAYLKRQGLDGRLLANMSSCRMGGMFDNAIEEFSNTKLKCNRPTFFRRLSKIFNPHTEAQLREAFATPQSTQTFLRARQQEFIEQFRPIAHNSPLPSPPNACLPYKASLMISVPPAEQRLLAGILTFESGQYDLDGKKMMAATMLHLPSMSDNFLREVDHPFQHFRSLSQNVVAAQQFANNPMFLLAFDNKRLRENLLAHQESMSDCEYQRSNARDDALNASIDARASQLYDQQHNSCAGLVANKLTACERRLRWTTRELASDEAPNPEMWARQNNYPACPTLQNFFDKQETINALIKAQNKRCQDTKSTHLKNFLCKRALPDLTPQQLAFKIGPKIFERFGDQAPRIMNATMLKNFCPQASSSDGGDEDEEAAPTADPAAVEENTLLDVNRPISDLTRFRQANNAMEDSNYARLNRALCPQLKGRRANGEEFSCANAPRAPECSSPAGIKSMACQALSSQLAQNSSISADDRLRIMSYPTDEFALDHAYKFTTPGSDDPSAGIHLLELQRFAHSLPGENPDANCRMSATVAASVSGSGSGSGGAATVDWLGGDLASSTPNGSSGNSLFSDYFMAAQTSDEESLRAFANANPSIATGTPADDVPATTPYVRRLEPPATENFIAPAESAPLTPVAPALGDNPNVAPSANTETSAPNPTARTGSLEERVPLMAPPLTPATEPITDTTPARTPRPTIPTPIAAQTDSNEEQALRDEMREYEKTLRDYDRQIKKLEREELAAASNPNKGNPQPTVPKSRAPVTAAPTNSDTYADASNPSDNSSPALPAAATGNNSQASESKTLASQQDDEKSTKDKAGQSASSATKRAPASNGALNSQLNSLSDKAKNLLNKIESDPLNEAIDKIFGIPGIRDSDDHYSFETTLILPHSFVKYGIQHVVTALELEAMNFAVLKRDTFDQKLKLIIYSWNPDGLSWEELSTPPEIARRIRLKRFAEELRTQKMFDDLSELAQGTKASFEYPLANSSEIRTARRNLLTPTRYGQVIKKLRLLINKKKH
jgi:hypothetical protein